MHRYIASTRSAAASTPARITGHDADGYAIPEPGSAQREQRDVYGMQEGCLSESHPGWHHPAQPTPQRRLRANR
ncbi:MAG: hypothetical protein ACI4PZ_01770, partial [Akkermansia sp.]